MYLKIIMQLVARIKAMGWLEWAAISMFAEKVFTADVKKEINDAIVKEAAERAGVTLDAENPLSDASLANAVFQRTGIPLRSLRDQVLIKEDLDTWAASLVSAKSGYTIRSVSNVAILKEDLQRTACAVLTERLGIPAGVLPSDGQAFDPEAIKTRLLAWAKAEIMTRVGEDVGVSVDEIMALGDVESVAYELNSLLKLADSDMTVTGRKLAVRVVNQLAARSVVEYQQVVQGDTKASRRRLQNRKAQERFRAKWGNRQKYVPLDMNAVIG
ncbi:hypothetical protein AT959_14840 [Dechloromonas denitrificans]|uniref:BZIP domain-containing protein n=1 Tax=Dechloromonas denitrificans TaxID=281362 RepID=A0A133XE84_9RHOO|nr:hypothetical protein [Dechloromonas denitrificans]KXB29250.1 hypothetical protein AT959_14840 [Dechloromonas denitrificans]